MVEQPLGEEALFGGDKGAEGKVVLGRGEVDNGTRFGCWLGCGVGGGGGVRRDCE